MEIVSKSDMFSSQFSPQFPTKHNILGDIPMKEMEDILRLTKYETINVEISPPNGMTFWMRLIFNLKCYQAGGYEI